MERILKCVEETYAKNIKEFECLKTYRLVFESVSEIIFSQKLKKDKKQPWLDVCDTKSSWLVYFTDHHCKTILGTLCSKSCSTFSK